MKPLIKILICLILVSCDNNTRVIDSKDKGKLESENIEKEKKHYEKVRDSLNTEIINLSKNISSIESKKGFAEVEIFNIIKK